MLFTVAGTIYFRVCVFRTSAIVWSTCADQIWRVTLVMYNIEMLVVRRLYVCVCLDFHWALYLNLVESFQVGHCSNLYSEVIVLFL